MRTSFRTTISLPAFATFCAFAGVAAAIEYEGLLLQNGHSAAPPVETKAMLPAPCDLNSILESECSSSFPNPLPKLMEGGTRELNLVRLGEDWNFDLLLECDGLC